MSSADAILSGHFLGCRSGCSHFNAKDVKQRETARVITMHSSNLIEDFMRCVRVRMDAHVGSLAQPK